VVGRGSALNVLKEQQRHCPDFSYGRYDAGDSGVVIEVSHSHKRVYLPYLANDYILGSNGAIRAVIGIDFEYREEKGLEAKVFVWRPKLVEREGVVALEASLTFEGIFRAADGSLANGDQTLSIQLQDFGNKAACPGIENISGEVMIPFSELHDFVQMAEEFERRSEALRDLRRSQMLAPGVKRLVGVRPQPGEPDGQVRFQVLEG